MPVCTSALQPRWTRLRQPRPLRTGALEVRPAGRALSGNERPARSSRCD